MERRYGTSEEIANGVTHGIGTLLAVAGMVVLVTFSALHGDIWRIVSFSIYGATLTMLYLCSTLYHTFQKPELKRIFRMLDHSAIFLLIAGTYTPFTLVTMRGPWGWTMFGIFWTIAVFGIVWTVLAIDKFKALSALLYVGMGWSVVIAIKPLIEAIPKGGMYWVSAGGITYTVGVIFYIWKKLPYNHAIWHLFVIAGSLLHFFAMLYYVLPMQN